MKICIFCGANSSADPEVEIMAKKVALLEVRGHRTNVTDSSALCTESPYPELTLKGGIGGQRCSGR